MEDQGPVGWTGIRGLNKTKEPNVFSSCDSKGYSDPLPGVRMKTLCYGDKTLLSEFRLTGGTVLPLHSHVYEQTGYLVSGRLLLTIGDEQHEVAPGDSWSIPGDVRHGAKCLEDAVAIEVFAPVREDYLPLT